MKISESDLQKLTAAMEKKSISVEQAVKLIDKGDIQGERVIFTDEIKLTIDYNKTIDQAISEGNYNWNHVDIAPEHFPISPAMIGKIVEVDTKIFHFNYSISSNDAISEMDRVGYRPATLVELLTLGILFPELQRQFPIVALGSVWRSALGARHVPSLDVDGSKRELYLDWFAIGWDAHCRFLGVRK